MPLIVRWLVLNKVGIDFNFIENPYNHWNNINSGPTYPATVGRGGRLLPGIGWTQRAVGRNAEMEMKANGKTNEKELVIFKGGLRF